MKSQNKINNKIKLTKICFYLCCALISRSALATEEQDLWEHPLDSTTPPKEIVCKTTNAGSKLTDTLKFEIDAANECVDLQYFVGSRGNCPRGNEYTTCNKLHYQVSTCGFGIQQLHYSEKVYRVTQIDLDAHLNFTPANGDGSLIDLSAAFIEYNAGMFIQGLKVNGYSKDTLPPSKYIPPHKRYPDCLKTRLGCEYIGHIAKDDKHNQSVDFILPEHFVDAKCVKIMSGN